MALVKYETIFLFLYFFLFLSHFIFSCLFFLPFPFLPLILIQSYYYIIICPLKTKPLIDERKQHQRHFISFFLDAALVGEQMAGMEVAALQHGGGVTEDEVNSALSYIRAE